MGPNRTSINFNRSTSPTDSFDDSGYISADDEPSIKHLPSYSVSETYAVQGSLTPKSSPKSTPDRHLPKTPQRPPPLASFDSGISMTLDSHNNGQKKNFEPISPLAYKKESNPLRQHIQPANQATAPLAHDLLPKIKYPGSSEFKYVKPVFVPFYNPTKKMTQYIQQPFKGNALETGYLYIFQVDGHSLNKVGYTERSNEASYVRRMKGHERCGWTPKTVFLCKVLHAERVEKIIHYHLEEYRRKEINSSNSKCGHSTHQEWFEISLQEIVAIAQTWVRWMEAKPYVERNGKFVLRAEWHKKLKNIQFNLEGDYWMDWLSHHLAEKLQINDIDKTDTTSPAMNSPTTMDIPLRLKRSKTWPRRIYPASSDKY